MLKDNNFKNLILKLNFLQSFEGGQTFFDYASPSYSIIEFFIKKRFYLCPCLRLAVMKATFDANFGMVRNKKVGKSFRKSFPIRTNFLSLIRAPWTEQNITELCFAPTTRCDCLPNKETFGKTILLVGWHHGPMLHGSSSFLATIGMSKNNRLIQPQIKDVVYLNTNVWQLTSRVSIN